MSSEHAVEQVPLAEIREGDTIQDPQSGQWITVTRTAEGTTSVIHKYSDGERTATQEDRVYYGDEGEIADSRFVNVCAGPGNVIRVGRIRTFTD